MEIRSDLTLEQIYERAAEYLQEDEVELLKRAYEAAKLAHEGQFRKSGEPYVIHPMQVAGILVGLKMDPKTVVAGFLHDVIEDTDVTAEELTEQFGEEVVSLVEGVTKLGLIKLRSSDAFSTNSIKASQAESHRKMFIAMASDFRVIIIKFADRLHNIRTLGHLKPEKQKKIAKETMEIFAPLANRLGISTIAIELENNSLKYLCPKEYEEIVRKIEERRQEREAYLTEVMASIREKLRNAGIDAEVFGRPKHIYSVYRKNILQDRPFDQIYDLIAIRIITKSTKDCYAALGFIHTCWRPIPGRFKDYVAIPKTNMYQSIHTTVIGPNAVPFEVQIRTEEMHQVAQFGLAAHWSYKSGIKNENTNAKRKLDFFKEFIEMQADEVGGDEFMKSLKLDFLADLIYVFSPKGDLLELPKGAVALDFAYRVHSELGNKTVGVKVNGRIATLDTVLESGDIVEVLTAKNSHGPSRDWLKFVKSSHTKQRIKQFLKKKDREENIVIGRDSVEKSLRKHNVDFKKVFAKEVLDSIIRKSKYTNPDDCFAAVGFGEISSDRVAAKLMEHLKRENPEVVCPSFSVTSDGKLKDNSAEGVVVPGLDNLLISLSKCCSPIPGDEIIGYITKGRGISVHKSNCQNLQVSNGDDRLIAVEWSKFTSNKQYRVALDIYGSDRVGIFNDVLSIISGMKINLANIRANSTAGSATIHLNIYVKDLEHLQGLINKISQVNGIVEVKRKDK